jgi:hypothetical protein
MSDRPFDQHGAAPSTRDVAMEETRSVGHDAKESARSVAQTATAEVQNVAGEARSQVASLYQQVRSDVTDQAGSQQRRAADGLHGLAGELQQMADSAQQGGMATGLARQAAERLDDVAGWLEQREPTDVLEDVKRYARRNPGTFLAAAAVLGFVGGRLTRGLRDDASDHGQQARTDGSASTGMGDLPMTTATYGSAGIYDAAGGVGTASAGYGGRPGPAAETYTSAGVAVSTPGYEEPVVTPASDEVGVPATDALYDEDIRAVDEGEPVYPTTADAGRFDDGGERR